MRIDPLVSIIIDNFNNARFLREAIESALGQSYKNIEVIVVDDGSVDNSHEIMTSYGDRFLAVFQENKGQAGALNTGFSQCHGDIVIFLDSDDLLYPKIVDCVVAAFRATSNTTGNVAMVQYRLDLIDGSGAAMGSIIPPQHLNMPTGDLRPLVLGNAEIRWQPTSGNAFAAEILRQIFPLPEEHCRTEADIYLHKLPALLGNVISIEEVGGCFRIHGSNNHKITGKDLYRIRERIDRILVTDRYIQQFALRHGLTRELHNPKSVRFLALCLASLKLDPHGHPFEGDRVLQLGYRGVSACFGRIDLSFHVKVVHVLWFMAMTFAPRVVAEWLVTKFFNPALRLRFTRVLGIFHRSKLVFQPNDFST